MAHAGSGPLCADLSATSRRCSTLWHRLATLGEGFDTDAWIRHRVMMKTRGARYTRHLRAAVDVRRRVWRE